MCSPISRQIIGASPPTCVQVEHLGLQHLLAAEREELTGQAGGALRGLVHHLHVAPARVSGGRPREEDLASPDDDGEQVVEVVSHPARELPDRLHLLRLNELIPGLRELRKELCVSS